MKNYSVLAKHTLIYGVGSIITAIAGFILVPIHTNILSLSEYGLLELLNRIADVLILVMFMGFRQAYIRTYFEKEDAEWQKIVTMSTIVFSLVSSISIALIIYPLNYVLADLFSADILTPNIFMMVLLWIPFEMIFNIGLSYLQVRMKSLLYVVANLFKFILFISLNVYYLYYANKGIEGVILAQLVGTGLISIIFLVYFIRWGGAKVSLSVIKEMVKFGLPYLPATIFMYVINNSDRYFIGIFATIDDLGIYALAYKLGMFGTALLLEPFTKVWAPFVFKTYKEENGSILIGNVFTVFIIASVFVSLIISNLSYVVVPLIASNEYNFASNIIPLITLAYVFYGMSCLVDVGILIKKKTKFKPLIFGITSVICVFLNYILVPRYGLYGAGTAILGSFIFLFVFTLYISSRYYKIEINMQKVVTIVMLGVISYFIALYGRSEGESWIESLPTILISICVYIILIIILYHKLIMENPLTKEYITSVKLKLSKKNHD